MVLVIDDEPRGISTYAEELDILGYTVVLCSKVDAALDLFKSTGSNIELVVLDIMMAPGTFGNDPTVDMGLRTGVKVYEKIREHSCELPVIILTNVSDPKVTTRFSSEPNCMFFQKKDCLPCQLGEAVATMLVSSSERKGKS